MERVTIKHLSYEVIFEMGALAKNVLLKDAEEIRNPEKNENAKTLATLQIGASVPRLH